MIKFANKSLPDYVKVTDIRYSILPSIERKTEQIYGRAGTYDFGIELGERKIEVDVMIIAENQNDVMKKSRELTTFLFYKELQPLIMLDEPDKQYMARVSGDTEVNELYRTGSATITFMCPSPYAESLTEKEVKVSPTDNTPILVTNNGSAETYPIINLTMKESATSIAVISEDKFVQIGGDESPDSTATNLKPIVLHDNMASYSGWTQASTVDNGIISGDFVSTGNVVTQLNSEFGEGTAWHGASAIKSLSRPVSNFEAELKVKLTATNVKQMGRIELYFLDQYNVAIGKIVIVDSDKYGNYTRVIARAGTEETGKIFTDSYGYKKGVWHDFTGVLKLTRIGQNWTSYFAKVNADGSQGTKLTTHWYDTNNAYSVRQVAKVQIHIGAYNTYDPVKTMHLDNLKVTEILGSDTGSVAPILFDAGDIVTIDNQRAIVLKNGEPIFTELDPSSDFFSLETGSNGLIVSPPLADVSIRYKERYL